MRYINGDNVSPTGDGGGILDTGGLSRNPQGKKEGDKEKRKEKKQCAGHSALLSSRSAGLCLLTPRRDPATSVRGATGLAKMSPSDQTHLPNARGGKVLPPGGFHPRGPQGSPRCWVRSMECYWSVSSVSNSCPCHPLVPADHGIHEFPSMPPAHVRRGCRPCPLLTCLHPSPCLVWLPGLFVDRPPTALLFSLLGLSLLPGFFGQHLVLWAEGQDPTAPFSYGKCIGFYSAEQVPTTFAAGNNSHLQLPDAGLRSLLRAP